jgi:hypothetical protein
METTNDQERCCTGCGLPPKENNGVVTRLKSCSRCKQAWYHDVACQRKDLKRHRREGCKVAAQEKIKASPLVRIEKREGRGTCLVAASQLQRGYVLLQNQPLVPPILLLEQSMQRCAVCFGRLNAMFQFDDVVHSPQYPVHLCSHECLSTSSSWLRQEEQLVSNILCQTTKVRIFSTTILLYRIVRAAAAASSDTTTAARQLENLQQHTLPRMTDEEEAHVKAVAAVARLMLGQDPQTKANDYTFDYLASVLTKMKTNGFSVADGESIAIGIGLYPEASFTNHSCSPNAIQTFIYGVKGKSPVVRLTVCESGIASNEEICISYIDNAVPRGHRQTLLQDTYYFQCCCQSCTIKQPTGLRCYSCQSSSVVAKDQEYHCQDCDATNFKDAKKKMENFPRQPTKKSSEEMRALFESFQSLFVESSWYYQECGDRYVQALLDEIGTCRDETDRMRLCHQALAVAEGLLLLPGKGWRILRSTLLKYKCAKLRLFVQPDPRMAIGELQDCLHELLIFYPPDHELIHDLKATLSQAFM